MSDSPRRLRSSDAQQRSDMERLEARVQALERNNGLAKRVLHLEQGNYLRGWRVVADRFNDLSYHFFLKLTASLLLAGMATSVFARVLVHNSN